jgi:hypothetical protein
MTTEQKIIRAKVGLLELAKQLGNVSQACKMMGFCNGPRFVNPSCVIQSPGSCFCPGSAHGRHLMGV